MSYTRSPFLVPTDSLWNIWPFGAVALRLEHKRRLVYGNSRPTVRCVISFGNIALMTALGSWEHDLDLGMPPTNSNNEERDVLVTSVHWTQSKDYASLLLVTYLFHGYM